MIFGGVYYRVTGDSFVKLYRKIYDNGIPVRNMQEKNGVLTLGLSWGYCKRFEELCKSEGCTAERTTKVGLIKLAKLIRSRPGLIAGLAVSLGLWYYYSDVVLTLEVQTDNEKLRSQVTYALKEEGITPGTYIPDINFTVAEREVKKKVGDISWLGISREGSGLTVDIIENIPAAEGIDQGMPSHLTACENGVIEELEVLDGQVKLGVGCGVVKGDIIVSGEIVTESSQWIDGKEIVDRKTAYAKSIGKVYGTFERQMVFEQPFEQLTEIKTGRKEDISFINFFSADIPLFAKLPEGSFTADEERISPTLFGLSMPFGVTRIELSEYDLKNKKLTEDEALEELGDAAYRYEQNFLKDYTIKDRQCVTEKTEKGMTMTVSYTLYGVISREEKFFAPEI